MGFAKLHYKKEICKLIEAKLYPPISKKQPRLLSISLLIEEAKQFVRSNNETAVTLGINYQIDENSSLWYNCPALQRFEAAIRNRNERYIFAWHGTHGHSISSIFHEGFDPKRRQGQAKGKGEYFGVSATSSKSYTKNSNKMIVVCILDVKLGCIFFGLKIAAKNCSFFETKIAAKNYEFLPSLSPHFTNQIMEEGASHPSSKPPSRLR